MEPDRRTRALGAFLTRAVGPVERHTPEKRARLRRRDAPRFVRELLEAARPPQLRKPRSNDAVPSRWCAISSRATPGRRFNTACTIRSC